MTSILSSPPCRTRGKTAETRITQEIRETSHQHLLRDDMREIERKVYTSQNIARKRGEVLPRTLQKPE